MITSLTLPQIVLLIQIHRCHPRMLEDYDGQDPLMADLKCLEDRGFIAGESLGPTIPGPTTLGITENGQRLIESIRTLTLLG